MNILFIGGMFERKLKSKISPLQNSKLIEKIYLVRKEKFIGDKIINFSSPKLIKKRYFMSEALRVFSIIYILIFKKVDYIIAAGFMPHGIYANTIGYLFKKKRILLLMGQIEIDLSYPSKNVFSEFLLKIALKSTYIAVRGTNSKKKLVLHGYDSSKIFIPHNIFNFNDFKPLGFNKEYELIFVGNFHKEKRIDLLLKIANKLKNDYDLNFKMLLVGSGYLKENLVVQANLLGISDVIFFKDFTEQVDLEILLNKSRILVLTSEFEGLPMVIIEALSCGLPVVSFDIADISDIIKDGINGYLCGFGDLDLYCKKIYLLLTNNTLYDEIGKNCLEFRKANMNLFSLSSVTSTWDKILLNGKKNN